MVSSKHAFWQALVFTIVVFGLGLLIGFFAERSIADSIETDILNSEISLLDEQVRSRIIFGDSSLLLNNKDEPRDPENITRLGHFEIGCEQAKKNTVSFADKIYEEAIKLEKFEGSSKFGNTPLILHKKYDLLRVMLWMEAIQLKEQCSQDLHTITYLFEYGTEDIQTKAKQASISRLLFDIKSKYPEKTILIPIAGNLEIDSVNVILNRYEITEMPKIIIDEKIILDEKATFEEIEKIILAEEFNSFELI